MKKSPDPTESLQLIKCLNHYSFELTWTLKTLLANIAPGALAPILFGQYLTRGIVVTLFLFLETQPLNWADPDLKIGSAYQIVEYVI